MLVYGLRSLVALIIRGLLRTYCRFEIVGEEHLREQSLVRPGGESFQPSRHGLPARRRCRCAVCIARFPAAAADYFFQSVPRTWIGSRDRECAAVRAADARPAKACRDLWRTAREPR